VKRESFTVYVVEPPSFVKKVLIEEMTTLDETAVEVNCPKNQEKPLAYLYLMLDVSLNRCSITQHIFSCWFMRTKQRGDPQQMTRSVYRISCKCGRNCAGETSRPYGVKEQALSLEQGHFKKSKLAQHAYEGGQHICCYEARLLQIELSSSYREHRESE
jgi:hypothetical protein